MLLQGERMDARIGADQSKLLPVASLNFVKMAVITVLIPVLDRVVFPLMDSVDRKPTLLQRIGQLSLCLTNDTFYLLGVAMASIFKRLTLL